MKPHERLPPHHRLRACCSAPLAQRGNKRAEVVVVGSGIIGISICNTLLKKSGGDLSVTLLEKHRPCYGATGAGQGYIWLAHRNTRTPAWELASWSRALWKQYIESDSSPAIEWQDTGSLLIADGKYELQQLEERRQALVDAGLRPEILYCDRLKDVEPSLQVTPSMSGLLLEYDSQMNGRLAAERMLQDCSQFGDKFKFIQGEGVAKFIMGGFDEGPRGVITDAGRRIDGDRGVVLAAGAWAGELLANLLGQEVWRSVIQPRKGHLLEFERPPGMPPVNHGLMELGYTQHYGDTAAQEELMITFTATTSASGSILLGSSREFAGFNQDASTTVRDAILSRAAQFIPSVASVAPASCCARVGVRPYSSAGPVIGEVPGYCGLFLAGGHEGSGLTLAPATAEIIASLILGDNVPAFTAALSPLSFLNNGSIS